MYENAKIENFLAEQDGTTLVIRVPNRYLGDFFYSHRIKDCEIRFDDGRTITNEQRKKAYATIRDIADWTGEPPEAMKEWLKYLHISRTGCRYFSLSNCSIDTAREYINTLLDYALENGIILLDFGVNRTDDIDRYLYSCLKNKREEKRMIPKNEKFVFAENIIQLLIRLVWNYSQKLIKSMELYIILERRTNGT